MFEVNFSRLELINPVDAWHPSVQGYKALAHAAFSAICPSLAFLGVGQRPMPKHRTRGGEYARPRDEDAVVHVQFRMRRMMRASLPILFSLSLR